MDRRELLQAALAAPLAAGATPATAEAVAGALERAAAAPDSFDPWMEVSRSAVEDNVRAIVRAAGGRTRLMPVIKANGYGQGARTIVEIVDRMPEVCGYMVARPGESLEVLGARPTRPVLLMAPASDAQTLEVAAAGGVVALTGKDSAESVASLARRLGRPLRVHLEVDTGINRQGKPYRDAVEWGIALHRSGAVKIEGLASYFIVPPDAVPQTGPWEPELEQIRRFEAVSAGLAAAGVPTGLRHMTSSRSFFQYPQAYFDALRMGVLPTGCYPTPEARATGKVAVRQTYEMKARVAQVSYVPQGEFIGYAHKTPAAPGGTWIATFLSGASNGTRPDRSILLNGRLCRVLLGGPRLYTVAELGPEPLARVGDIATITGRANPAITAEGLDNAWFGYDLPDRLTTRIVA